MSMHQGKFIFSQIMDRLPWRRFQTCVERYRGACVCVLRLRFRFHQHRVADPLPDDGGGGFGVFGDEFGNFVFQGT